MERKGKVMEKVSQDLEIAKTADKAEDRLHKADPWAKFMAHWGPQLVQPASMASSSQVAAGRHKKLGDDTGVDCGPEDCLSVKSH